MARTFLVGVKGESFANDDGTSRQDIIRSLRKGEPVKLIPDPTNQHGRWAVKVLVRNDQQIGWLPSDARDADALLKGEPISARIYAIRGGTNWLYRLLGKKHVGVVLELKKEELDWNRRTQLERLARPFDDQVQKALELERSNDAGAIAALQCAIDDIKEFTKANPYASAHRHFAAPIDRLSLILERQKRHREALQLIDDWKNSYDPIQPAKSIGETLRKRGERLKKKAK